VGRLRALECTIPFRINLQRVFHSSMVSPGTYVNLLAPYRCTVSVAIKRFSSIFNLYRCSFRFGQPLVYFCSFSPLFFPFFSFYFRAMRRTLHSFYEKAILLSGKRVSHARAIAHQSTGLLCVETYMHRAHLSTLSCSPETIKIPFAQINHCCPLRHDGKPSGMPAK